MIIKICKNISYRICRLYEKYANKKHALYMHYNVEYADICKTQIHTFMQKTKCINMQNMHKYTKLNMHKYAFSKYACA